MSAWDTPEIICEMYKLWPGASKMVNFFTQRLNGITKQLLINTLFSVQKCALPTSTVLPFSRSSSLVSFAKSNLIICYLINIYSKANPEPRRDTSFLFQLIWRQQRTWRVSEHRLAQSKPYKKG
jgi:hypothetical protein